MIYLKSAVNIIGVVLVGIVIVLLVPFILVGRGINKFLVGKPGYTDIYAPYYSSFDFYNGPKAWAESLADMPQSAIHLYAVHWAHHEIATGGFWQLFYNSAGVLAPEARDGFRAIGMDEVAALIQSAMDQVASPYPLIRDERQTIVKEPQDRMTFAQDAEFYALVCNPKTIGGKPLYYKFADAYAAQIRANQS